MSTPRINHVVPIIAGFIYGLLYALGSDIYSPFNINFSSPQFPEGLALLVFLPFALSLWQQFMHEKLLTLYLSDVEMQKYIRVERASWFIFVIPYPLFESISPNWALTLFVLSLLAAIQYTTFLFVMSFEKRAVLLGSERYIAVLFLISGFSALIYQVVWQRSLFAQFGINSEAVTVIVSVFMFGLGVGALAGGFLLKRYSQHLLALFIVLEVLIGVFGLFSLQFIQKISQLAINNSTIQLIGWSYVILATPTLLMGATLPILVAFLQKYFLNLGKTVGLLYAFNTIGSAIAAYFTVEVLFVFLGQTGTVIVAAICNFATALLIWNASHFFRSKHDQETTSLSNSPELDLAAPPKIPYALAFMSLAIIGYLSLSQEIIWYRLLGFLSGGRPQVFGILLCAFLIGIALGSLRSKKICELSQDPYRWIVRALFIASLTFYLAIPSVSFTSALLGKSAGEILAYFLTGLSAYFMGALFPLFIHFGITQKKTTSSMSMPFLYFANIIGASSGPMITGFILLEWLTLEQNILLLSSFNLGFLLFLLFFLPQENSYKLKIVSSMIGIIAIAGTLHKSLYELHLERMQFAEWNTKKFKYSQQNRAGIITVESNETDTIYGGGIYDGSFNIDIVKNRNNIDRAFMIATLHRAPKRVLAIGLSSGSWIKVLSQYAPLEELKVVEINQAYPQVIQYYPEIATILNNPKITLVNDDGRRWLRNHPNEKFDFILMNTTFYWRSNSTNLLSSDFLELCKKHLKPDGVIYYNTTGSMDVARTAANVFQNVITYINFVGASDSPFDQKIENKIANLKQFINTDGTSIFEQSKAHEDILIRLANTPLPNIRDTLIQNTKLQVITDNNMAVEFKLNKH